MKKALQTLKKIKEKIARLKVKECFDELVYKLNWLVTAICL